VTEVATARASGLPSGTETRVRKHRIGDPCLVPLLPRPEVRDLGSAGMSAGPLVFRMTRPCSFPGEGGRALLSPVSTQTEPAGPGIPMLGIGCEARIGFTAVPGEPGSSPRTVTESCETVLQGGRGPSDSSAAARPAPVGRSTRRSPGSARAVDEARDCRQRRGNCPHAPRPPGPVEGGSHGHASREGAPPRPPWPEGMKQAGCHLVDPVGQS